MRYFLLMATVFLLVAACSKDKFQSVPSLKIKSTSNKQVPVNGSLQVILEYTDKEGDLSDTIFIKKTRLNKRVVATVTSRDSLAYALPSFPNSTKGDVVVTLNYIALQSAQNPPNIPGSNPVMKEPDTLRLRFVIQDKARHRSDSVFLNDVIVFR